MDKCIANQTEHDITVTLYVAEFSKTGLKTKETHTIDIPPKAFKEVEYGSITNSFISGIEISAFINGAHITTSKKVDDTNNEFSLEINNNHFIEIKGLNALEIEMIE